MVERNEFQTPCHGQQHEVKGRKRHTLQVLNHDDWIRQQANQVAGNHGKNLHETNNTVIELLGDLFSI